MRYRIYPPIGIARLGQDDDYFLGPEIPGQGPQELGPDGSVTPVRRYKDAKQKKIRKQGARFHLFQSEDGVTWVPANLPQGATVSWTVRLVNKKSAVARPSDPPIAPMRPVVRPGSEGMVIDGGTRTISGLDGASEPLVGRYTTTGANGEPYNVTVELGRLYTDGSGRLIVVGGNGSSGAPPNTALGGSYYRNPGWYDDVADGPITAEVRLGAGAPPIAAEGGAWVVVGPPDYAPEIAGVVTLYDTIRQVGVTRFGLPLPAPSFDRDIAPLITRVRRLRWVHDDASWSDPRLASPSLRSRGTAERPLRDGVRERVLSVERKLAGHTDPAGPRYELREFQRHYLDQWVAGDFDDAPAPPARLTAQGLTQASLDGAVGQGFCPGIEAGIILLDPEIYVNPFDFRIDQSVLGPGDLTALMAQPWQADFLKCNTEWWPTQRPDLAFQTATESDDWIRGADSHRSLVDNTGRLGIIVREGPDEVFLERERDPEF